MADLLLASALVLPDHRLPLLIGAGISKVLGIVLRRRCTPPPANDATKHSDITDAVTVTWENLSCTLSSPDGTSRHLLHGLNGRAHPGRLLAIMGASGSGKTTLLTALAGQVNHSSKLRLEGRIAVNATPLQQSNHRHAFVQQEDLFFSMLTVRETLEFAAQLRLPQSMSPEDRAAAVSSTLQALGLVNVRDTRVGDAKTRGLSGGEKKRLQIACELIASPRLVFAGAVWCGQTALTSSDHHRRADQWPRHGLCAAGHAIPQKLGRCWAHGGGVHSSGWCCITRMHVQSAPPQPRSSICAMFDDVLLLAEGREVYHGPADAMLAHFESLGHLCPEHFNPAEVRMRDVLMRQICNTCLVQFVMDLMSLDYSSPETLQASKYAL